MIKKKCVSGQYVKVFDYPHMHIKVEISLLYYYQCLRKIFIDSKENHKKFQGFFKPVYSWVQTRCSHFVIVMRPAEQLPSGPQLPLLTERRHSFIPGCTPFLLCCTPFHFKSQMSSLKASTVCLDVRIKQEAWGDSVMAVAPRLSLSSSLFSGYQRIKGLNGKVTAKKKKAHFRFLLANRSYVLE